jgi:putative transposase
MFITVNELAGLPGLPGTPQGIRYAMNKLAANSPELMRRRQGSKAIEYHIDCLPAEAREVVRQRHYTSVLEQSGCKSVDVPVKRSKAIKPSNELEIMRQCPALVTREVSALNAKQKSVADARALLALEVLRLRDAGMSRLAAVQFIVDGSRDGTLPDHIMDAALIANARKGSSRKGVGKSSLQEWVTIYQETENSVERLIMLAPGYHKAKKPEEIFWMMDFLQHYRIWKRPTVAEAYEKFEAEWARVYAGNSAMLAALPSIHAVRRELKKLPVIHRERFRRTGSAWRSLNPFVRRDWSQMPVNAVWVGDGHGMKMRAFNPETGNTFKPEVTFVMDAGQRFIVGWSLALSENVVAVTDALRHGISQHGIPLIYYSDNGGGEKNKVLDAEITGILPRLGIEHHTGIPGNPQGRGVIERPNKDIPRKIARGFESYCGKDADGETVRLQDRIIQSAVKAFHTGKDLTKRQVSMMEKVPTWEQLLSAIESEVERYNNRPHSELPRMANGEHYSPAAYRSKLLKEQGEDMVIDYLSQEELHEMFRPEIIRTVDRGEVRLFNNLYFANELKFEHGNEVRVCYDIHDPNSVIVRRMDGSFICDALWDGNKVDAFAKPVIQKLTEERVKGRIARAQEKILDAQRELQPVLEHKPENSIHELLREAQKEAEGIYLYETERADSNKKNGTHHN